MSPPALSEVTALAPEVTRQPATHNAQRTVLVDSHCHLADPAFDSDREAVLDRARAAGVKYFLVIGGDDREIGQVMAMDAREEGIFAAAGIHPHEARDFVESDVRELRKLASRAKFLAIGEIGLDYHYDYSPRDTQKEVFIRQLELASELRLPVVIHCREAWADLRQIIDAHRHDLERGGILHCFTGSREDAFHLVDCGFMVSFAGNLTFKNADSMRQTAKQIPLQKLLVETDSPYLAPAPHRGQRNEPAFVREVVRTLASLHALDEDKMAMQTFENFRCFFRLL